MKQRGRYVSISYLAIGVSVVALAVLALGWVLGVGDSADKSVSAAQSRGSSDDEAFRLYEKGRRLWQNRSVEGLHNATISLEQAVARDPEFALAHAALADAYAFDVNNWTKAEATANEAIRLDPNLGAPHATIGFIRTFWEWNLLAAETHFKRAIALDPDYSTAHQWYALNLAARTHGGAAIAEMQRALELEPRSPAITADLCQVLYFSGKYDMAIERCHNAIEIDPNFLNAHAYLYEIYSAKGMYDEALEEYFRAERLNMTEATARGEAEKLRNAYAAGGIREFWRQRIETLKRASSYSGYGLAQYYARLGDRKSACESLMRAYEVRDFALLFFAIDPVFDGLVEDPRFRELERTFLRSESIMERQARFEPALTHTIANQP